MSDVCYECIDKERLWSVYIGGWASFQVIVGLGVMFFFCSHLVTCSWLGWSLLWEAD